MITVRLRSLPAYMRAPIAAFVLVGLVGYAAGLAFVGYNTGMWSEGISDHYHGNEEELKFGKSTAEMLETVHTHLLGMGVLFFALALLYTFSDAAPRWKTFWATETLLSLLSTFGSLWLVAVGQHWAVWIIYPSSVLMVCGYLVMSCVILWDCVRPGRSAASA
jgi:multisubunit Na+/H+ antiporter MnhB subunit